MIRLDSTSPAPSLRWQLVLLPIQVTPFTASPARRIEVGMAFKVSSVRQSCCPSPSLIQLCFDNKENKKS